MNPGIFGFPGRSGQIIRQLYRGGVFRQAVFDVAGSDTFSLPYSALLLLWGCGGGGGGGGSNTSGWGGSGGGAASLALPLFKLILPAGEIVTLSIGAGGNGGTTATNGAAGGSTTLSIRGNLFLTIDGGAGGISFSNGGTGGGGALYTNGLLMAGTSGGALGSDGGVAVIHEFSDVILSPILTRGSPGQTAGQNATQFGSGGGGGFSSGGGAGKNGFVELWHRPLMLDAFG